MKRVTRFMKRHWGWLILGSIGIMVIIGTTFFITTRGSLEHVHLKYSGYSGVGKVTVSDRAVSAVRKQLVKKVATQRHEQTKVRQTVGRSASWQEIYLYSRLSSTFDQEELNEKNILMKYPIEIRPATGLKNGDKIKLRLALTAADARKYHLSNPTITRTVHGLKKPKQTVTAANLKQQLKVSFTGFEGHGVVMVSSKRYGNKMRFTLPQNGHLKNGQTIKLRLEDDYRLNQMTHGITFKGTDTYRVHGLQAQGTIANLKGVQSFCDSYAEYDRQFNEATWVKKQRLAIYLMPFTLDQEDDLFIDGGINERAETVYVTQPKKALLAPSSALTVLGLYRVTEPNDKTSLRAFARKEMVLKKGGVIQMRLSKGNFSEEVYDFSDYSQDQVQNALAKYGQQIN